MHCQQTQQHSITETRHGAASGERCFSGAATSVLFLRHCCQWRGAVVTHTVAVHGRCVCVCVCVLELEHAQHNSAPYPTSGARCNHCPHSLSRGLYPNISRLSFPSLSTLLFPPSSAAFASRFCPPSSLLSALCARTYCHYRPHNPVAHWSGCSKKKFYKEHPRRHRNIP